MDFKTLFANSKPIIGMIHTGSTSSKLILETAKEEIEIYLKYGVYPLIENYFGDADDCEAVLKWMKETHPDDTYGVNILGDYRKAFAFASEYGAKFIQIDSVCGHLKPENDEKYAAELQRFRDNSDIVLLGGVRFKYQPVKSGRTVADDLKLGRQRCDAIVCTGAGTGEATPIHKIREFQIYTDDFPVIVGAGVTLDSAKETFSIADGAIIGSWFKQGHVANNPVEEAYVKEFCETVIKNQYQQRKRR